MRALKEQLVAQITAQGPISLAEYMHICLLHPQHGYYATRDPFGVAGDFTTAPEISQMFGEVLGLCLAQCWIDQGRPENAVFAELGPGRGTLMRDILRATASVMGPRPVHLVEASATLRGIQADTLLGHNVHWHDQISELPDAPFFLIANEFFDALPIRQFRRGETGWHERQIGVADGNLILGETAEAPLEALEHRLSDTEPGHIVETRAGADALIALLSEKIAAHGGTVLVIDYGDWRSIGDTFQALKAHKPVDPLSNPGSADLTAHVAFEPLAINAACAVTQMTTQGRLLERLGITPRAQALAKSLAGDALESHIAAHQRLTHPDAMGHLFKAIALYPEGMSPPAGFDA